MSILTRQQHSDNQQYLKQQFCLPDAEISLWPDWLGQQSQMLLQLQQQLAWSQDSITLFGKAVKIPRQQVWMGDPHCHYRYSGTRFAPQPWHPLVLSLTKQVSRFLAQPFNCVLLNLYANGQQHMGWHADNEPELGDDPIIASLSLGATRRFDLKHRHNDWQLSLNLTPGSLMLMSGNCQQYWLHRLPKQSSVQTARINLTFRYIKDKI